MRILPAKILYRLPLSAALLVVLTNSLNGQQPAKPPTVAKCNCVFTDDCGKGEICGTLACDNPNPEDPLKPITGFCVLKNAPGNPAILGQALGAILLAYETAGTTPQGGSVNPSLLTELKRLGLSQSQQRSLHEVALTIMSMYIGLGDAKAPFRSGYVIVPRATEAYEDVRLGTVARFQGYLIRAAPRIRQAIVAELLKPQEHTLERTLKDVFSQTPRFLTFGRCESPSPMIGASPRYRDGITCLNAEIGRILAKLRETGN